uniref:Uncharacterized protein LOC111130815 n=1 Tax=Crassostrea virginica TaxID=6565 RepID=A0A8B8E3A0_CRAVI|nr:uncharacterized protein LOC111130815 [Crassostrea virginica]
MMAQVEMNHQKFIPRCIKHEDDLLPLFCRDCNCLMCSDCITTDHVGHDICKLSDVAEFHQKKLENVLECSDSMSLLEKMLQQLQQKQINLAKDSENLICKISEREEEIIQRVKLWSKRLIGNVNTSRERSCLSLKHDENIINALLNFEDLSKEIDTINIVGTYLHIEVERLLPSKMEFTQEGKESDEYKFEAGSSGEDLDKSFGRLEHHSEQESSSDVFTEDAANISDSEDESVFYECHEKNLTQTCIYQTCTKAPIDGIVVFNDCRIFILSNGTLFQCDTNSNDDYLNHRIILHDVYQIAQIPSTKEVLCIMKGQKRIERLSERNTITRLLFTKNPAKTFCAVSSGGNQSYACVILRFIQHCTNGDRAFYYICLLNEYGVIFREYSYLFGAANELKEAEWKLLPSQGFNNIIVLRLLHSVENVDTSKDPFFSRNNVVVYSGSIGVDPESQFSPSAMIIDNKENILVVVNDDRAIHLLDRSLKFQRLILSEEDGLQSPWSVTLDSSGYLWVGCRDGTVHVFNYQYLLRTERSARSH